MVEAINLGMLSSSVKLVIVYKIILIIVKLLGSRD